MPKVENIKLFSNNLAESSIATCKFYKLDNESAEMLMDAMNRLNLSARAHDRILKVSRTIADLDGSENIQMKHLVQGIQYPRKPSH